MLLKKCDDFFNYLFIFHLILDKCSEQRGLSRSLQSFLIAHDTHLSQSRLIKEQIGKSHLILTSYGKI